MTFVSGVTHVAAERLLEREAEFALKRQVFAASERRATAQRFERRRFDLALADDGG